MSRWRRLGLVGAIFSVVVLTTACAAPSVSLPFANQPVITPQQARVTFLQLESRRTVAIHDGSKSALAKIETGEALTNDDGEIDVDRNGWDTDGEGFPFGAVRMVVPRMTTYPAWFAAQTWAPDVRAFDVLSKQGPNAPWKLEFETISDGPFPTIIRKNGYAVSAGLERNLSKDLGNYYESAIAQQPTQFVLPGPDTSKEVQNDLNDISSRHSSGVSESVTFVPGAFDYHEGLSLGGGAVLGFATYQVVVSYSDENGSCFLEDPASFQQRFGSIGNPGKDLQVTLTSVASALVVESRKGDQVIGQDFTEIRDDQVSC